MTVVYDAAGCEDTVIELETTGVALMFIGLSCSILTCMGRDGVKVGVGFSEDEGEDDGSATPRSLKTSPR